MDQAISKKEKADAILNIIINSIFIGIFVLSLVFVLGDVLVFTAKSSGTVDSSAIGLKFIFKDGWANLKTNKDSVSYIQVIVTTIGYIGTIVATYLFSILGLIKGIKALVHKEKFQGFKYFIIIGLTYLGFYVICNSLFNYRIIESTGPNTLTYIIATFGWGSKGISAIYNLGLFVLLGYFCFKSFSKSNIRGFIASILTSLSLFSLVEIITYTSGVANFIGMHSSTSIYEDLSLGVFQLLSLCVTTSGFSSLKGLAIAQVVILLLSLAALMVFLILLVKPVKMEKVKNSFQLAFGITTIALMLFLVIFTTVVANKLLTTLYGSTSSYIGTSGTDIIIAFVGSFFFLGFSIASYILNKKETVQVKCACEEPEVIEAEIVNESKEEK